MSINFDYARSQMLGQQIRAWEVLDSTVLDVMRATRREDFVPESYRELAFADTEIPLANRQKMMSPMMEGRLLQSLQVSSADDVLEIGTGSGYLTACLAKLAAQVTSIDIYPDFVETAGDKLRRSRLKNVALDVADGTRLSYSEQFDVIAVTGSVPELTEGLVEMLRPNGRLFVVVGRAPVMEARLVTRAATGGWTTNPMFETMLAPLINSEKAEPFTL